ncbi:MAG: MoaD/ThiS family protein [Deltaproteobacteria bacterium]|nr:MoaD/ThiS family protein [Deltaproteobacteria bacterium]
MKIHLRSTYAVGSSVGAGESDAPMPGSRVELAPGATVQDLLERFPALGPAESYDDIMIHVFVNGRLRGFDHRLEPGDVVDIHIPVSGG